MAAKVNISARLESLIAKDRGKWLASSVDAYLEGPGHEEPRVDPGWWHPSSLPTLCEAQLAFDFLGIPRDEKVSAKLRRIYDNGQGRDLYWKNYLRNAGLSALTGDYLTGPCPGCGLVRYYRDTPYRPARHICLPEVRIRGEFDDLIRYTDDGLFIFECKTKNDGLWKAMRGPDPDHVIQVQPYMVARGVDTAIILYENKNDQLVKTFEVKHDPVLWDTILQRLALVREKLDKGYDILRGCKGACAYSNCSLFDFGAYRETFPSPA